jgi:hypothetical protein
MERWHSDCRPRDELQQSRDLFERGYLPEEITVGSQVTNTDLRGSTCIRGLAHSRLCAGARSFAVLTSVARRPSRHSR